MSKKLLILFFLMIMIASPLVVADKVINSVQETGNLEIIYPHIEYLKAGVDYQFNTHVYNISGVILTNSSTYCNLHLYNSTGNHLIFENMSYDVIDQDFYFYINKENISKTGFYSYIIQCESPNYGGSISNNFEVTKDGLSNDLNDSSSGIAITIFLIGITFFFMWMSFSSYEFSLDMIANFIIKKGLLIISVYFTILNTAIISSIAAKANLGVSGDILTYTWIFGWGGYILIVYLIFSTLLRVIKLWKINKKQKRTGVV
jgi:hypothetical protein